MRLDVSDGLEPNPSLVLLGVRVYELPRENPLMLLLNDRLVVDFGGGCGGYGINEWTVSNASAVEHHEMKYRRFFVFMERFIDPWRNVWVGVSRDESCSILRG